MRTESFGSNYGQPSGKDGVNQLKGTLGKKKTKPQFQCVNLVHHKFN